MFHTFQETCRYLDTFTDYERQSARYSEETYNLDRMRRLVAALGHPERAFKSLHIAGTKGKGSVAHMTEAILREAGYRTGLYTSPHLMHLLERIRVGGRPIPERDFVRAMNRMEPHLRRLRPTFFEIMTAAAFLLFARKRVDYAVVEVGLGGRLDATNVIHPVACAITTIDYDHVDRLGRTLGRIAAEKAGILKPGVPAVSSPQRPEAWKAIRRMGEPSQIRIQRFHESDSVLKFTLEGVRGKVNRCTLPLRGAHQAVNAATAVGLVEHSGADVPPSVVRRALRKVRVPGRIETLAHRPRIIVDVAHNPIAARALAAALRPLRRRKTILVFGASEDKDYRALLRTLLPLADLAIFTRARSPRAATPEALARHARGAAVLVPDVKEAFALARRLARASDLILVTGSFYVAGEALSAWNDRTTE